MLASNVSDGLVVREQKPARLEQAMGSWRPQVPLAYLGWGKPVKFVSAPSIRDVWSARQRFCHWECRGC